MDVDVATTSTIFDSLAKKIEDLRVYFVGVPCERALSGLELGIYDVEEVATVFGGRSSDHVVVDVYRKVTPMSTTVVFDILVV